VLHWALALSVTADWVQANFRLYTENLQKILSAPIDQTAHWTLYYTHIYTVTLVVFTALWLGVYVLNLNLNLNVGLSSCAFLFFYAAVCGLFFLFYVAEVFILNDMHIHVLDISMITHASLHLVLKRQLGMIMNGVFLPKHYYEHSWRYLWTFAGAEGAILLLSVGLSRLLQFFASKAPEKLFRMTCVVLAFVLVGAFSLFGYWIGAVGGPVSVGRSDFLNWLPWNAVYLLVPFSTVSGEFIHVWPSLTPFDATNFFKAPTAGYPFVPLPFATDPNRTLHIRDRKNIFLFTTETFVNAFGNEAHNPHLFAWQRHAHNRCFTTHGHVSLATVTEQAHFALYYSIYPVQSHTFLKNYVYAFPLSILRQNGYKLAYWSPSAPWQFPTDVLLNGNLGLEKNKKEKATNYISNNRQALDQAVRFLQARKTDGQPFFLHLHLHSRGGERSQDFRQTDLDRQSILTLAESLGQLKEALVVVSGDHGERDNDFGGNWHASRIVVPFSVCLPTQAFSPAVHYSKLNAKRPVVWPLTLPVVSSHLDFGPTFFRFLGLPLPETSYSQGNALPLLAWLSEINPYTLTVAQLEDRTVYEKDTFVLFHTRSLFLFPRWFPHSSKVLGLLTPGPRLADLILLQMIWINTIYSNDSATIGFWEKTALFLSVRNFTTHAVLNNTGCDPPAHILRCLNFRQSLNQLVSDQIMWKYIKTDPRPL